MEPKEFEWKFREFMQREMNGFEYQVIIAYSNGSINKEGGIGVTTQTIGFDPRKVPFSVAHSLFKGIELAAATMIQGIYGGEAIKNERENYKDLMHR